MTPRFTKAISLAARAHEGQNRKGTPIPYITHPVAVAGLVAQFGGDEDQQIAALLHDVLEDGGPQFAAEIEREFGTRVLTIVEGCTDGVPDATGQKSPWAVRKQAYITHLAAQKLTSCWSPAATNSATHGLSWMTWWPSAQLCSSALQQRKKARSGITLNCQRYSPQQTRLWRHNLLGLSRKSESWLRRHDNTKLPKFHAGHHSLARYIRRDSSLPFSNEINLSD